MCQIKASLVSVVIPTYRRSELLGHAIESVINQGSIVKEIIVVDDNSDLGEMEKVRDLISRFPKEHSIVYKRNDRKKGGGGARNTGIYYSSAKYIAFLDDDDVWLESKLERQISLLESGDFSASFCGFYDSDIVFQRNAVFAPASPNITKQSLHDGNCPASTSLAVVHRAVLLNVNGFDESFVSFQDYDLWMKCIEHGEFCVVKEPLAIFSQHTGDRVSVNIEKRMKGLEQFCNKWSGELTKDQVSKLKRKYTLYALIANAKAAYPNSYFLSLWWSIKAVSRFPTAVMALKWMLLSLMGYQLGYKASRVMRSREQ